ncbi:MAG: biotin/lipoyl-containing protein [Myxococcota bacterium]
MKGFEWVEIDGRRIRVGVVRTSKGVWVSWPGASAFVERERHAAGESAADDRVTAPMTGKVVRVAVCDGDSVETDALLVVLEAMKMEYRLTAPHAGRVSEVRCSEGELVDLGATLVVLETE